MSEALGGLTREMAMTIMAHGSGTDNKTRVDSVGRHKGSRNNERENGMRYQLQNSGQKTHSH
jgi:hypothetical protein